MPEEQKFINVEKDALKDKVSEFYNSGYRLAQIGCAALENFEITYSFDKDYGLVNLRVVLPRDNAEIPSVSDVYPNAFIYENEIHDLFGIKVNGLTVDYKGNFYRMAVKTPYAAKDSQKEEKPEGEQSG